MVLQPVTHRDDPPPSIHHPPHDVPFVSQDGRSALEGELPRGSVEALPFRFFLTNFGDVFELGLQLIIVYHR